MGAAVVVVTNDDDDGVVLVVDTVDTILADIFRLKR
jgi:hypothetical protein